MLGIKAHTPIEQYFIGETPIWVKREDLCVDPKSGAPPFSKMRGVVEVLTKLNSNGVKVVGYTETSISMAGWGIAWAAAQIGIKVVIFNPIYKDPKPELIYHREQWKKYGADIIDIKAGMAKVNWNISRKILKSKYGEGAVMFPLGIPFQDTILATRMEAGIVARERSYSSVVVCVGSGTICAGLFKAFGEETHIYGVMTRTGNIFKKKQQIAYKMGLTLWLGDYPQFTLIDPRYEYTDSVDIDIPWPTNRFYDAKAALWMIKNIEKLEKPILFWNIGSNSIGADTPCIRT